MRPIFFFNEVTYNEMMPIPFPVFAIIAAIVGSVIAQWLQARASKMIKLSEDKPRIFVVLISYCDRRWPEQVEQMISSATHPGRVFFGILEFVKNAEDSCEATIPAAWRSRVRVHAVSHRIATSLREARRLCYDKTYSDEPYVLFLRAASMVQAWDELLMQTTTARTDHPVVSMHLGSTCTPRFPTVSKGEDGLRVKQAFFAIPTRDLLPSLLWQADLSFASHEATDIILSTSDIMEVSTLLMRDGWFLATIGVCLAVREAHPVGVRSAKKLADGALLEEYERRVDVSGAHAALGLTNSADSPELIGKYGSLVAARVALQTAEAKRGARSSP